ncbi:MAG: sodium:solute symporter family protein [Thermoguttaceae bacterium]
MTPFLMILGYLCLLLWVAWLGYVGRSRHTAADFFLASRTCGAFLLVMSIFGTTMTSFALVGSTGEAFRKGIGVYGQMASWSGIIHSACFFLIGMKLWHFGRLYGYSTQIQYFRDRFQSPALGMILFPILVGLVVPYVLINILGSGQTIQSVTRGAFPVLFESTGGGIPAWLGSGAVCLVVLLYVFGGGMRSLAFANGLHATILILLGAAALFLMIGKLGGPVAASERVAELRPDLLVRGAVGNVPGHISHMEFLTYLFVPLSVGMFPHLFQHWMTAKSAKTFRWVLLLHPVFIMIVWCPCILLGIWASTAMFNGHLVIPAGTPPDQVLGTMVKTLTNRWVAGLLGVGIVSATMSLDSQFLALSSMFTHDIVLRLFGERRFSDKQQILLARALVLTIVATAYVISLCAPRSVFTLGVWCFSGFSSLFPLVFSSLYWKRVTKAGAMACIATAAVVWVLLFAASGCGANREYLFLGMMPVVTIFAASTLALVVVSLATAPPSEEVLERFFLTARRQATESNPVIKPVLIPPLAPMPGEMMPVRQA